MFSLIEDVSSVNKLLFSRFIYDKKAIKAKLKKKYLKIVDLMFKNYKLSFRKEIKNYCPSLATIFNFLFL